MFAGNDPVNYADPSGLAMQGHPLSGGYIGNVTMAPTIPSGNLGLGPALSPSTNAFLKDTVNQALNPPRSTPTTLRLAPAAEEAVVRQITQGAPIVPRSAADLPGVRAAINDPNRHIVANHSNQGYLVANPDGSVRFVTGADYLPIQELSRRAAIEGSSAAGRASFADFGTEALISFSPIHKTTRDALIAFGGYDYNNSNLRISDAQSRNAVQMLLLPGGNSGQIRKVNDFVDSVQDFRRAANNVAPHPSPHLSPSAPPQRVQGPWTQRDLERAAQGKGPLDFAPTRNRMGREVPLELHHADQMPGSAIHEMLPFHGNTPGAHGNKYNQGVTPQMRKRDAQLHWQMRGQEMGNPPPPPGTK